MITKEQIKAARAMLDWSQQTLADNCHDVSTPTIKLIESGKVNSTPGTLGAIQETLENAGLEFLPQNGVRFRDDTLTIIEKENENDNVFLKLLDDVFYTLKGSYGELLYSFVDNSVSSPVVTDREQMIRKDGITMRSLVRYEDTYLIFPLDEYRYLPKGSYINNPTLVYGNKYAVVVKDGKGDVAKAIIIHDVNVADVKRKEFEIIWQTGTKPSQTTAEKTYE